MSWQKITSEQEMNKLVVGCRVNRTEFSKPGWYYIEYSTQRCPRGCCYDDVIESMTPDEYISMVSEKMRDLAYELKQAKEYKNESECS
jgi:hypothetical protein